MNKYDGGLSESDFFDKVLINLTDGNLTFWKCLFNRIFWFMCLLFISFITAQNKFLIIFNAIVIVINAYLVGIDIGIIFSIFSMRGIIFTILIYIPLLLISMLSLLLINCVFIKKVQEYTKYGAICSKKDIYMVLCLILFLSIFLQAALLPIFNNIFIIIE